ncbi:hypothetical protein RSOLAG22IIIB_00418 [Rhizoctonia solani]|uniref:Uncharacterized protein n=1 Tax=Rhizoctonia solani TaxID=456999 RepID=A0A0K6FVN8_9AGAM|nr:unnamed protein product [Rhizoctonia solani]CUA70072.1 hypothetical protein RSOLAG22IIIB_00418 [Rhizoctonia solani]
MATIRISSASPSPPMSPASPRTPPPVSPLTSTILRANGTIADLSRTLSDLSSAEYHPSEDAGRVDVMCCCRNRDCEVSRAWADAERKLIVSAEVGQALLERHEAFERRHEALVKQNDSQTEHIATLNSQVSALQEELAAHTRVQKQLAQAQLNLEAADAANRTLTKELQESRANISRLSAAHARGVGLEAKLRTAEQEREDLRREITEANNKAKVWETKANDAGARFRKLQAEMVQLRDETDSIKLSRSEISSDILEDARARLQLLHNMLGQTSVASDDPEVMRVLEALVADNEALKRDAAELQNMLTESREDVRMLQEEIGEMRARGEGGQEPLAEDATDMSFTRSTPPPYNSLSQGLGAHGRNASWASVNGRSGWAASFANSAKSPRGTGAQLDPRSGARSPQAGSAHSSRAASFSGNARLTSPSTSRFPRRVSSPRAIPPLVIPPMKRHGAKGPADEETGSENPLSAGSSALYSPRGLAPPVNQYRRTSAANSIASERNTPLVSPGSEGERTPAGGPRPEGNDDVQSVAGASDMTGSVLAANEPESPEKPKQRRPLMLLSRSRGVQTDELAPIPSSAAYSNSHTPAVVPSPRAGSISLSTSDTPSSPIMGPAPPINPEHLAALLKRLQQADVRGLTARLKRQNLIGADLAHLSRSTLKNISTDVRNELGSGRGPLGRTIREMLGEIITLRGVVNDVVLDPNAITRVREEAFTGIGIPGSESVANLGTVVERGRQTLMRSQSAAMGWISAPINKLFGGTGESEVGLAGGRKRLAPRVAPAIATSTTTVNVEFAHTGTRRAVSTMTIAPDKTVTPPNGEVVPVPRESSRPPGDTDQRKEQLRGIFVGSQAVRERERTESWVILPRSNSRRMVRPAKSTANLTAGDTTVRGVRPRRISRNVDAVIDVPPMPAGVGQSQLLDRALRPRGLSDSSIRSTFIVHAPNLSEAIEVANSSGGQLDTDTNASLPATVPELSFNASSVAYASTSTSGSTGTSPSRAIASRKYGVPGGNGYGATASRSVSESVPASFAPGHRMPRRSVWAGVITDEEDSFQVGSFKEGVTFGTSLIRHRDRASGRGASEDLA